MAPLGANTHEKVNEQQQHTLSFFYVYFLTTLSAHEVKNNCCLFERLLKVKKNSIFLFGIPFLFLEIFTFLYYANEDSDDVIGGSIKTV